ASYTPNALYTESNGTLGPANAEIVRRTAVGRYEVDLPNVAPSESSMAIVSAHGTAPTHACVNGWLPRAAGGTTVRVETYTAAGTSTDATFTLHYLTNRPADGWPASNLTVGSGCHGVMLGAPVRPILGSDWSLELTGLPAGTILGFVQLGLANPAQPLGPQAPGCTSYTSGDATFFVFPPVQNPVYSLAIPTGAVGLSLLGLPIHAQGGAFAPGLNALSIALSPGLIGTVGDV
ncbi:MAG: hypothetical protein KDE27_05240, partial [Planctomycetes bacterium]|nr:hypothetical protein [Planctomycetota bacterium]